MKIRLTVLTILIFSIISSCKHTVNSDDIKRELPQSFKTETGYDVKEVSVIKESDFLYTGYVVLTDNSKAFIEVRIDKENSGNYMWRLIQPSPTMVNDVIEDSFKDLDATIDSTLNTLYDDYK